MPQYRCCMHQYNYGSMLRIHGSMLSDVAQCCASGINIAQCFASCINVAQFGSIICIMQQYGLVLCVMHLNYGTNLYTMAQCWCAFIAHWCASGISMALCYAMHQSWIILWLNCCALGINMAVCLANMAHCCASCINMFEYCMLIMHQNYGTTLCIHSSMLWIHSSMLCINTHS